MDLRNGAFEDMKACSTTPPTAGRASTRMTALANGTARWSAATTQATRPAGRCLVEAGGPAYARHKFVELHTTNKSQIAEAIIQYSAQFYEIERKVHGLGPDE